MPIWTLRIINTITFIFMIVMNYLANALPLNGKTTGALSDAYPNLFVPAGITFSIWGIIYLLITSFIVWQFLPKNESKTKEFGWYFAISSILNGLWILAWHYLLIELSILLMLGLLSTLVWMNGKKIAWSSTLVKLTFGIYLGWITIATIANFTALLVDYGFSGFGIADQIWAILLIVVGLIVAYVLISKLENPFIACSIIWAFCGIALKRWVDYPLIAWVAIAGVCITLLSTWILNRKLKSNKLSVI